MKRLSALLSAIALLTGIFTPVTAANLPEPLFYDVFDGYVTHQKPTQGTYISRRVYTGAEEEKQNKMLVADVDGSGLKVEFAVDTSKEVLFSFDIKAEVSQMSGDIGFVGSTGTMKLINISENGSVSSYDGRKLGGMFAKNFKSVAISYIPKTKKFSVWMDGKCILNKYKVDQGAIDKVQSIQMNFYNNSDALQQIMIDNVYIYNSDCPLPIKKYVNYDTRVMGLEEISGDSEGAVQHNLTFDTESESALFKILENGNILEVTDDGTGNNVYRMEKTVEGTSFRFVLPVQSENRLVVQADVKSDSPLTSTLFGLRYSSVSSVYYPVRVSSTGAMTSSNGISLGTLGRNWTNIAVAYNMGKKECDIYVNNELKAASVPFTVEFTTWPNYVYFVATADSNTESEMMFDNIRAYRGKEPTDTEFSDVEAYSAYFKELTPFIPDESDALNRLAGISMVSTTAETAYIMGNKVGVPGEVKNEDETVFVTSDLFEKITGTAPVKDENGVTVSNKAVPYEDEDGKLWINLENAATAVGLYYIYNDRGIVILNTEQAEVTQKDFVALNNYMLYDRPTQAQIMKLMTESGAENRHHRLYITEERIEELKQYYKTDEYFRSLIDDVLEPRVHGHMSEGVPKYERDTRNTLRSLTQRSLTLVMSAALLYEIKGDPKILEWTKQLALNYASWPEWRSAEGRVCLDNGHLCTVVGLVYDWYYDELKPEERDILADAIYNLSVLPMFLHFHAQKHYDIGADNNRTGIISSGLILGAAAIYERHPEICADVIANSLFNCEAPLAAIYENNGLWFEGATYTAYIFTNLEFTPITLMNMFGHDFNLSKTPYLDQIASVVQYYNGYAYAANFGDAQLSDAVSGTYYMWVAQQYNNKEVAANRKHQLLEKRSSLSHHDIACYVPVSDSDYVEPKLDGYIPGDEMLSFRTSANDKSGAWVISHAGYTYKSHAHMDVGSFMIDMMGERFAWDLGSEDYSAPGYSSDSPETKYSYYKAKAEGHNLFSINPDKGFEQVIGTKYRQIFCPVVKYESKDKGGFGIIDLTNAYSHRAKSAKRGIMLGDDRQSVKIRDEFELNGTDNTIYWFMHLKNAKVDIVDANTADITVNNKIARLTFVTDAESAELSVMDAVRLPESGEAAGPEESTSEFSKIAIKLTGSGKVGISVKLAPKVTPYTIEPVDNTPLSLWQIPDGEAVFYKQSPDAVYINGKKYEDFDSGIYTYVVPEEYGTLNEISADVADYMVQETNGSVMSLYHRNVPEVKYVYTFLTQRPQYQGDISSLMRYPVVNYSCSSEQVDNTNNNNAGNAFDGNFATRWSAGGPGEWLTMDLGEVKDIEAIGVGVFKGSERYQMLKIMVSDNGENWNELFGGVTTLENGNDMNYYSAGCSARYVRLIGYQCSANKWNSITEFAVYGK